MPKYILSVLRSALGVMTSRIFGLIRDIAIAGVYGATAVTDIFFVAFAIPNLFRQFFAEGAISSAYIPFLSDKTKHQGIVAANRYLTQLMVIQTVIIAVLSMVLVIFAPYVIMLFMPGYTGDPQYTALGAAILRIVMPYLLFVSISGLLAGHLNLHNSYFVGYASTSCLNLAMITGSVMGYFRNGDIFALSISVLAGGFLQAVLIYGFSRRKGFEFGLMSPLDPDVKKTYRLLIPSLAGVGISQLNFLVGRVIASFLAHGSISWLFYANRLFQFPLGIFSVTVSTVCLTELSKARSNGDIHLVNAIIDKAITGLLLIMIPATIGLVGLSEEITALIYSRNAFSYESVINTAKALQMYSAGLLFYSFAAVFTKVYHSRKDTATPVKIAAVAFFINLVLNLILMKPMGHYGIALSSSVAALFNSILLYVNFRDYSFNFRGNAVILIKILSAAYIMLAIMALGKYFNLHVLINIILCVVFYFGSLAVMKVNIKRIFR